MHEMQIYVILCKEPDQPVVFTGGLGTYDPRGTEQKTTVLEHSPLAGDLGKPPQASRAFRTN